MWLSKFLKNPCLLTKSPKYPMHWMQCNALFLKGSIFKRIIIISIFRLKNQNKIKTQPDKGS